MRERGTARSRLRSAWKLSGLVALAAGLSTGGCANPESSLASRGASPDQPPNVIFVLVDALRADRLGVNGYSLPTTPNLDALAGEGVNFTSFYSHSTWTKPSIATLFTSLYPSQHGVGTVAVQGKKGMVTDVLGDDLTTLAERFQAAGYDTLAVVNQVHLKPAFGFAQGFDFYRPRRGSSAFRINIVFERQLSKRGETGKPVFGYLHYLDAHWPFTRRLDEKSRPFGSLRMSSPAPDSGAEVAGWIAAGVSHADLRALKAKYDHEVAWVDAAIADVVRILRERGLYDNTILVVTSDHGEAFLEHGLLQHSSDPFDELVRIPLVMRLPGSRAGGAITVDEPAGLIDLFPTLLELAGLEPEPQSQGRSLVRWIDGAEPTGRTVFMEHGGRRTARSPEAKLMERTSGGREFYDLRSDPGETTPVSGVCTGECLTLEGRLDRFIAYLAKTGRAEGGPMGSLDSGDLEELEALGYL